MSQSAVFFVDCIVIVFLVQQNKKNRCFGSFKEVYLIRMENGNMFSPFYLPYLSGGYADGHLISLFIYLQFIKKIVIYKLTQTMCLDKTDT